MAIGLSTMITNLTSRSSQFELIRDPRGDVFESDGSSTNPLESDSIQAQPRKFAHFHFPLNDGIHVRISMHAQQQKTFTSLVIATIGLENALDLFHHVVRIHAGGGFHAPSET